MTQPLTDPAFAEIEIEHDIAANWAGEPHVYNASDPEVDLCDECGRAPEDHL